MAQTFFYKENDQKQKTRNFILIYNILLNKFGKFLKLFSILFIHIEFYKTKSQNYSDKISN